MYLADTQETKPINGKTVPPMNSTVLEAPGIYCSDGESYESCVENIDDDQTSDVYTDTFDEKAQNKYLSTWLWRKRDQLKTQKPVIA